MTLMLLAIALTHLLAIATPGPTFVVVSSHVVAGDRRAGFLVTLGVLLATLTWASMAAAGLGTLLSQQPWLYSMLKWVGGLYLGWLGLKTLRDAWYGKPQHVRSAAATSGGWSAVRAGFTTNMANPKVVAYYASLFGVLIPADAPTVMFVSAVVVALIVSALWWCFITLFFSMPVIQGIYVRSRRSFDAIMGVVLIGLAGRLVFSR